MGRLFSTSGIIATAVNGAVAAFADISQVAAGNLPATWTLTAMAGLGLAFSHISTGRRDSELKAKIDALVRSDASDRDKAQQLIDLFDLPTDGDASNESALVLLAHGLKRQADQHSITLEQVNAAIPKIVESLDRIEDKLEEVLQRPHLTEELEAKIEARYRDELAELRQQNAELRSDKSTLRSALEFAQEQARHGDRLSEEAIEQLRRDGDTEKLLKALVADRDRNQRETTERNLQVAEIAYLRGELDIANAALRTVLASAPNDRDAINQLARIHWLRGDLDSAEEGYKRVLELSAEDEIGQAIAYGNLGSLYKTRGELDSAESSLMKSLRLYEKMGRKEGMASNYCNLGVIHQSRHNCDAAEKMYREALAINLDLRREAGIANAYGNLGLLHKERGELDAAEQMYEQSLAIDERLGRKEGIANSYANLGVLYGMREDADTARQFLIRSRQLFAEIGMPHMVAQLQSWLDELDAISPPASA